MGGALTLTRAALLSANGLALAWEEMKDRTTEQTRTELTLLTADIAGAGADIDISLRNSGQTALADFANWDVVVQYYQASGNSGLVIDWFSYTSSPTPANGQWTVRGIYLDADTLEPEVYDPDILNPGEEMIVRINVTPAIPVQTDNLATIGAANGITVSAPFSR